MHLRLRHDDHRTDHVSLRRSHLLEVERQDGLPVRRYGFVNGRPHRNGRVVVMFDGDLKGETTVATTELQPVSIMTIDLIIDDLELLNDPTLRQALVGSLGI